MNPAQTLQLASTDLRRRAGALVGTARDFAYAGLGVVATLQEEALDTFGALVREGRRAGQGRAGQGRAGQGRAGQGRAGQGRAGQGRAETTTAQAVQAVESDIEQATRKTGAFGNGFEARVVEMVGVVLNRMNVPTRDDIEALKRSVDRLNKKAADLRLS